MRGFQAGVNGDFFVFMRTVCKLRRRSRTRANEFRRQEKKCKIVCATLTKNSTTGSDRPLALCKNHAWPALMLRQLFYFCMTRLHKLIILINNADYVTTKEKNYVTEVVAWTKNGYWWRGKNSFQNDKQLILNLRLTADERNNESLPRDKVADCDRTCRFISAIRRAPGWKEKSRGLLTNSTWNGNQSRNRSENRFHTPK